MAARRPGLPQEGADPRPEEQGPRTTQSAPPLPVRVLLEFLLVPLALLALAIGAFGIGTTEFVIMGLLPEVAGDYGVTIPTAGLLVPGYARGVLAGAPLMTVLGTRVPRKRMLMLLMGLFTIGNLTSALA